MMNRAGTWTAAVILLAAAAQLLAYWPGVMPHDAVVQFGQVMGEPLNDWHPPAFAWLWRKLLPLGGGPRPMLLVQALLYWTGFAFLAAREIRAERPRLALALAACGLLPIGYALIGAVSKDALLAAVLLTVAGLIAWPNRAPRVFALLLALFAATLRFNAFLAVLPLAVAAVPAGWRRGPTRLAAIIFVIALPLVLIGPVINRLAHVQKSGVERSLILFDLGGISAFSGADVFPPMGIADPVAVNRNCYTARWWDAYAAWAPKPCPINFNSFNKAVAASGRSPYAFWIDAVARHPVAYASHRLAHFNENIRLFTLRQVGAPVYDRTEPNPWHVDTPPNPLRNLLSALVKISAYSPIGWPVCWLATALGIAILLPDLQSRARIAPLVLSALLYGGGYLVFSVAADLRYHLWTMVATLVALVLTVGDLKTGSTVSRRKLVIALLPLLLVLTAGILWRAFAIAAALGH